MLCYERETNFRGPELDRDMGTFLADHFRLQRFLFNLIVLVLSIRYSLFFFCYGQLPKIAAERKMLYP